LLRGIRIRLKVCDAWKAIRQQSQLTARSGFESTGKVLNSSWQKRVDLANANLESDQCSEEQSIMQLPRPQQMFQDKHVYEKKWSTSTGTRSCSDTSESRLNGQSRRAPNQFLTSGYRCTYTFLRAHACWSHVQTCCAFNCSH